MSDNQSQVADLLRIEWLLNAGFLITGPSGAVAIDPYLSDGCETLYGLRRAHPTVYTAMELPASVVVATHWHEDHFDQDSAATLAERGITFVGPPSCKARFTGRGLPSEQFIPLSAGESIAVEGMTISATPARHLVPGFLAEDAIGVVVEMAGERVYHSGDTEYDRSLLQAGDRGALSAALVSINGTGGNMNPIEAACFVAQLRPACVVPMHFGLWESESTADRDRLVDQFTMAIEALDPSIAVRVPFVGGDLAVVAPSGIDGSE